jgi:hypothetical protein
MLVIKSGAPAILNTLLTTMSGNDELIRACLHLTGALSAGSDNIIPLLDAGILRSIIHNMKQRRDDQETLEMAINVIGNMAADVSVEWISKMIAEGALISIISVGSVHPENVQIQIVAFFSFWNLFFCSGFTQSSGQSHPLRRISRQ